MIHAEEHPGRDRREKIGFIGVDPMGKSMASNPIKAGYELAVYDRVQG